LKMYRPLYTSQSPPKHRLAHIKRLVVYKPAPPAKVATKI
jgi:hypothetical protein